MQFLRDSGNIDHMALHGITPEEAEQVIENDPLDAGAVIRNGESRTLHIGETDAGSVLFVVLIERDGMYRVVTARPARKDERDIYSKQKAATDDQNPGHP